MSDGKPGRPKGTRVTPCKCGHRVVGKLGSTVACPGCERRVKIVASKGKKKTPVYLSVPRHSRKVRRKKSSKKTK